METINKAKILLGISKDFSEETNEILSLLKEITEEELSFYCGEGVQPSETLMAQLVVIKYQRRGTETLISADYSASKESYINGYPSYIANQLKLLGSRGKRLKTL